MTYPKDFVTSDSDRPAPIEILPYLPSYFGRGEEEDAAKLQDLVGATIVRIGTPAKLDLDGGGLAIEYRRVGDEVNRVLLMGFNEIGMWIEAVEEA